MATRRRRRRTSCNRGLKKNPSIQTQVFTSRDDAEMFARLLRGKGRKVVVKKSRGAFRVKWISPHNRAQKKNPRHVTLNEAKRVLPKNRLTDVLVKRGGRVFKAKAKYDPKLGRVRVFVNPRVVKKINPSGVPTFTANFHSKDAAEKAKLRYLLRGYTATIVKIGKTYELRVYGNGK